MNKILHLIMAVVLCSFVSVGQTASPAFPDAFKVTLSSEGLDVTQGVDQGVYTIAVEGECDVDELTVTVAVPEGWDGFVGITDSDMDPGIDPLTAKAPRLEEPEWVPVEMLTAYGFKQGNSLVFKIDGNEHAGQLLLCWNGNADQANMISVEVNVTKKPAAPEFPDSFDVTLSCEGLDVTQGVDQGVYTIAVEGECDADELTVTVAVPEGWDGFVGMTDSDMNPGIDPLTAKAPRLEEPEWVPVEMLTAYGFKQGNSLVFKIDGNEHYGQLLLCWNGNADQANMISVEVNVTKRTSGIEAIGTDAGTTRYYDLLGTEVVNPKAGIYIKVVNGKATKVIVK